jgi:hypothetical protein
MNKHRKIQEEINSLFETCLEQFEQISSYDGKIPQIELDIIMSNIRIMYDQFVKLNKMNKSEERGMEIKNETSGSMDTATEQSKPVVHERKMETKEEMGTKENPSVPDSSYNTDPVEKKSPVPVSSGLSHTESIAQKGKSNTKTASLFDSNADNDDDDADIPSINEKLNKTTENSLAEKLKQNRVNDLKHAIGINEKFLFINELFEGSLNEYNNAISQINSLTSKDEADKYIESELKLKYNWNDASKAHSIFIQLIERRFS